MIDHGPNMVDHHLVSVMTIIADHGQTIKKEIQLLLHHDVTMYDHQTWSKEVSDKLHILNLFVGRSA